MIYVAIPLSILRRSRHELRHRSQSGQRVQEKHRSPKGKPAHHLYVCMQDSLALQNHIAFRDYLRKHPSDVLAYSTLKKQLAERFSNDRDQYMKGKTWFIMSILKKCGL